MNAKQAWVWYTVLRLLFFAVPFGILVFLLPRYLTQGITWAILFAAICSALISLSLSVLFLAGLRERASEGLAQWRQKSRTSDDEFEDDAVDRSGPDADGASGSDANGLTESDADGLSGSIARGQGETDAFPATVATAPERDARRAANPGADETPRDREPRESASR